MEWRSIKGFPGYEISDDGQVKSYKQSKEGKLLTLNQSKKGYLEVRLQDMDGSQCTKKVHRLVLSTFAPCEGMEELTVDHIDCDPSNNNLENLRWMKAEDNLQRAIDSGRRTCYGYSRKGGRIRITFEDGHIEEYDNIARAVEGTGMCKKTLNRHLQHPEGVVGAHRNIKVEVIKD